MGSLDGLSKGLIGDTLISAAAIAYIGAFTPRYRRNLLSYWLQLCQTYSIDVSENFELTDFLAEPIEIQRWLNFSLPHDKHSIEVILVLLFLFMYFFYSSRAPGGAMGERKTERGTATTVCQLMPMD